MAWLNSFARIQHRPARLKLSSRINLSTPRLNPPRTPQIQLSARDRQERRLRPEAAPDPHPLLPRHPGDRGKGHPRSIQRALGLQRHLPLGDHRVPPEDPHHPPAQHKSCPAAARLLPTLRSDVEEGVHDEDRGRRKGTRPERSPGGARVEEGAVLHKGEEEEQAGGGAAPQVVLPEDDRERQAEEPQLAQRDEGDGARDKGTREPL